MSRLINRLSGRVYGWFDSKEARSQSKPLPAKFHRRAMLALENLEARDVPATFTVTNTNDSGIGSLRAAITLANTTVGGDTINFNTTAGPGLVDFSAGRNIIAITSVLPSFVNEDIVITGPGADKLVLTRGVTTALNRPITFTGNAATPPNATITGLTISGFSGTTSGGAIFTSARTTLNLIDVNISGNTGGTGGAIYQNQSGNINIDRSTISNNSSSSNGGAIRFFGTGYATFNTLKITNSTISSNTATNGGAISFQSGAGATTIANSTITGNSSTSITTTTGYNGGAISRGGTTTAMTLTITSSIIAGNSVNASIVAASKRPDIAPNTGLTITVNDSLIGSSDTFTFTGSNNSTGTVASPLSAKTSILGFNGGTTATVMPLGGASPSDAIGKGTNSASGLDQTGATRVAPFDRGAIEVTPNVPFGSAQLLANIFASGGTSYSFNVNFYDDATIDSTSIGDGNYSITGPNGFTANATKTAYNSGTQIATYSFTPPGGTWDGNDNGLYSINLNGSQVKNSNGVFAAAGFEGAFAVLAPVPTAAISGTADLFTGGGATHTFKVTYTDATAIDAATFGNDDIRVTGPNSYNEVATKIAVDVAGNGTPRTVTYQINAPGGTWDFADTGTYTVSVELQKVANTGGTFVPAGPAGSFLFEIGKTFTVTNANDSGTGSLRQALTDANLTTAADFVEFDASFFATPRTIAFSNEIPISNAVIINGTGADKLTFSGGSGTRLFNVNGTGKIAVTFNNLSLANGSASTGGGGAILNADEAITLDGVYAYGNISSTLGGVINNTIAGYSLTIRNSTLTGNSAGSNGGAAYMSSLTTASSLVVINSTVSFNTAASTGGAFYFVNGGAATTTQLRNSTFVGNTATTTGGFLRTTATTHLITVDSSIISNLGPAATIDFSSSAVTATNSVISSSAGFTTSSYTGGVAQGTALATLKLASALAANGGTMPTLAILTGSPVIDKGANTQALTVDQRGTGFARVAGTTADIGAYEYDPSIPGGALGTFTATVNAGNAVANEPYTFTVVYSATDPIDGTSIDDGDEIRITGPGGFNKLATFVVATPSGNSTSITATYTFSAPANPTAGWDADDNGTYNVSIEGNQVQTTLGKFAPTGSIGSFAVAFAKTFVVNTTTDGGVGSLRQAILDANALAGTKDTITFDPVVFANPSTILMTAGAGAGQYTISDSLTITGPGADILNINGNFGTRHFTINGTGTVDVAITGLTISKGSGSNGAATITSATGGAVLVSGDETVLFDRVAFSSNVTATTFDGGAISGLAGSKITVRNSAFTGNIAGVTGGDGGAIAINGGNLTVENSTFSGNLAKSTGGAIYITNGTAGFGTTIISNSTLSGNTASSATLGGGAAILQQGAVGSLGIRNSTITNNSSSVTTATAGFGGAVASTNAAVTVNIESSIVSGNTTGSVGRPDLSSAASTINVLNSAIGVNAGFTLSASPNSKNNLSFGANLKLGVLADNGGVGNPVLLTHLPASDSPVLDKGTNTFTLATDQRGQGTDTVNFPRVKTAADIGSVEAGFAQNPTATVTLSNVGLPESGLTLYTFEVKYTDTLGKVTQSTIDSSDVRITGPNGFNVVATLVSTDQPGNFTPITAKYSFVPPDNTVVGKWDPSDFGTYTATMELDQVSNTNGLFVVADVLGTFTVAIPQTFTVLNTNDSGTGSLRQAIIDANTSLAADTIVFDTAGTFATPQTITLATEIPITDALNINGIAGNGGRNIISGGGVTRIFNVDMPGIQTLNISNAKIVSASSATRGGAILFKQDTINLTDVDITNNTNSGNGGAIGGEVGGSNVLNMVRVNASNNKAATGGFIDLGGGGGTITVTDSTVSFNTATTGAGAFATPFVTLTVTNSTVNGNSAAASGGAFQFVNGATVNIINSTISGNTTNGATAGAAFNFASTATYTAKLSIRNSTITLNNNTATGASTSGGIHWANINANSTISIESTIIAGNLISSTSTTSSPDIRFSAARNIPGNNNLIGVNLTSETNATFTGTNALLTGQGKAAPLLAKLSPLSGNGGLTQTHSLQADSPAIDAGTNIATVLTTDQRGTGFPRETPTGFPDIGAFERDPSIPGAAVGTLVNITTGNAAANDPYTFTVTYSSSVNIDYTTTDDGDEVLVTGPNGFSKLATFVSATPSATNATIIAATYKFTAPTNGGAGWEFSDNGTYAVSMQANQVSTTAGKFVPGGTIGSFTVQFPAIYTVLNTNDSGAGSLRQAITDANNNPGFDQVVFNTDPLLGTDFDAGVNTINIATALPNTTGTAGNNITITGPGANLLTISPTGTGYHFMTLTAGTNTVEISNMKISGFSLSTGIAAGIEVLTDNFIGDGLFITNNILSAGSGGGLALRGLSHIIRNSTISNNSNGNATNGGGGAWISSSIAGNTTLFQNTTISNNTATVGGGISLAGHTGTVTIENTTITQNTATTATASGGVGRSSGTAALTVNVLNSIIAANVSTNVPDIGFTTGSVVNITNSVIGVGDTFAFTDGGNNKVGTLATQLNPNLATLSNYGGRTPTHLPNPGSPALDVYNGVAGLDQRGKARPATNADAGSVERQVSDGASYNPPSLPNVTTVNTNPYTYSVTFFNVDTATFGGDDFLITGPNSFSANATFVNFTGNAASATANYKFDAPINALAGFDASDNGLYTVSIVDAKIGIDGGGTFSGGPVGTFFVAIPGTYVVTNTKDSGTGSLRQAVLDSNASTNTFDTIVFEATTFNNPQTINLTSGELLITDSVMLNGPGKGLLTLNASAGSRVFNINNNVSGTASNVTIKDLKISGTSFAGLGGAVSIQDENVTFLRTILTGNTATTGGGAINVVLPAGGNILTIQDSLVTSNSATTVGSGDGGAIRLAAGNGTLVIRNSTLSGNSAMDDGGAVLLLSGTSLLVENSTLSGNAVGGAGSTSTTPDGAAIYFTGTVGGSGFNVRNATISGNTAGPGAGNTSSVSSALGLPLVTGTVTLANSTIVNNAANSTSTDSFDGAGGVSISGAGTLVLVSTIVANNASLNNHPDVGAQTAVNQTYSAVGSPLGFTQTAGSQFNVAFGTNLKLGALANNGGIVETHLPDADSILLDRGTNSFTLLTDARGGGTDTTNFPRTKGLTDIGAAEAGKSPTPFGYANTTHPTDGAATVSFTVTYYDTITGLDVTTLDDGDEILVTGPNSYSQLASFVSIDNNTNGSPRTVTYSIPGPGGTWNDTDNGAYVFTFQANQVKSVGGVFAANEDIGKLAVAFATPLVVSNTNDSGAGSLRQAVLDANALAGSDVITFSSLFNTPQVINITSGELLISDSVTIQGPGANKVSVSGNGTSRIFKVNNTSSKIDVTLFGMKITGGFATGTGTAVRGGGIDFTDENVTLDSLWITGNTSGGVGGGVSNTVNGGNLTILNSTIDNNIAQSGDTTYGGGGILTNLGGVIVIRNSTVANNTASAASAVGGGVVIYSSTTSFTMENVTVVGNSATTNGGGVRIFGGVVTSISNTIISGNSTGGAAKNLLFSGATTFDSFNSAIGDITSGTLSGASSGNISDTGLILGALQNNGGPMPTISLTSSNSPTDGVDEGPSTSTFTNDQRGAGFARVVNGKQDIGAFEVQSAAPVAQSFTVNNGAAQRSRITTITVNFSGTVVAADFNTLGAIKLTRNAVASPATGIIGDIVQTGPAAANHITVTQGTSTSLVLTFDNNGSFTNESVGVENGSLSDGFWKLEVGAVTLDTGTLALRRLYGDSTVSANGQVSGDDFLDFGNFFNGNDSRYDYNNDGTISGADALIFGNRFGRSL